MQIKVYDNKGATADRYTVVLGEEAPNGMMRHLFSMSEDAGSSLGVNQYIDTIDDKYEPSDDESEVSLSELPGEVVLAILERIIDGEYS